MKRSNCFLVDALDINQSNRIHLLSEFGLSADGFVLRLLSVLRLQVNFKISACPEVIALAIGQADVQLVKRLLEKSLELKIFESDGIDIWSSALCADMDVLSAKSKKAKESASRRWESPTNISNLDLDKVKDKVKVKDKGITNAFQKNENIKCERNANALLAIKMWNEIATKFDLPQIKEISKDRERKLKARINQAGSIPLFFQKVEEAIEKSSFLQGKNTQNWKSNFDFFLRDSSYIKAVEGTYSDTSYVNSIEKCTQFEKNMKILSMEAKDESSRNETNISLL